MLGACTPKANNDLWLNSKVPLEGVAAYDYRILDHWDNLDDSVERGYAGPSIWAWTADELPVDRIKTYGALNQKLGINGIVLNNVNANPKVLDAEHLARVAEIARILDEYGIRTYLAVNFASPQALGGLATSDPLNEEVIAWWKAKVAEIYGLIPDFGGFLVKASSEGQPGPQDFGRTHVDGANMLADALKPHNGIVMWRAFVYASNDTDRAKQAYEEFMPFDGEFRDNVIIQIKNGPVDFQPREPFSPLFGGLKHTAMAPELQITQEYTGQSKYFVFLGPLWEEFFIEDTYRDGPESEVYKVTTSCEPSLIAGVANVGQDANWCGSIFAQANWYAFGRLAWDPTLTSEQIAEEWIRITFPKPKLMSNRRFTKKFVEPVVDMMVTSHETCVDFMMPLGLHHLFAWEHHFGPDPGCKVEGARADWLPSYYHKADKDGIGFDRTRYGSDAVDQYNEPLASIYNFVETCPEELVLWFHHLPWDFPMEDGQSLWDNLCWHYDMGVLKSEEYVQTWEKMRPYVDAERFEAVAATLAEQVKGAKWWKETCLGYFESVKNN